MIIWALITLVVLGDMPIWAKVVESFEECSDFFYEKTEPQGMDQNTKKICQRFSTGGSFYATLYSPFHRIPVYSAYTFDPKCNLGDGQRSSWSIEPMLSAPLDSAGSDSDTGSDSDSDSDSEFDEEIMQPEAETKAWLARLGLLSMERIKSEQAVNADYANTGYDRGHLNPNSFQYKDGRQATFTLTNAAPMDACFNRVDWKQWEGAVRAVLKDLPKDEGTAYLVTGTVVSRSRDRQQRIPRKGIDDEDKEDKEYLRVTVPTHIWTAVCYKRNDDDAEKSFSFGFIGQNQPEARINIMKVTELNDKLSTLYDVPSVGIFKDDCFPNSEESNALSQKLYRKLELPVRSRRTDRLTMSPNILNQLGTSTSQFGDVGPSDPKRFKSTSASIHLYYDSIDTWFKQSELVKQLYGLACVLVQPIVGARIRKPHTELKKREISKDSKEITCSLVTEEISNCNTPCLYKEEAKGYYCLHGRTEIPCSPEYSIITVSGAKCNSGETCGKNGRDYYWCNVGSSMEYCSPPLPLGVGNNGKHCRYNHNCAKYGSSYTWCYTDFSNNWAECCSIEDRFSALSGKTCKPDHPCHDTYWYRHWCYTTDGSWEYCCTVSPVSR